MRMKGEGQARRPRLAITGLGWYTPLGPDVDSTWTRLCAGESAIQRIRRFDASGFPAHVAAEVHDMPSLPGMPDEDVRRLRRGARLFVSAGDQALADAGLMPGRDRRRIGVAVGASSSYLHLGYLRDAWRVRDATARRIDLARALAAADVPALHHDRMLAHSTAALAAARWGCRGPQVTIDTACAASLHALADACRLLWTGRADAMLVGSGSGLVTPFGLAAFGRLGALSPQPDPAAASRPFDRRRDGFVLGEGGGAVVLERLDAALARGARPYAELAGVGSSTGTQSLTDPSSGGVIEAQAMRCALADAHVPPDAIGYVAAHGTSTPKNDATETAAIKAVFGPRARDVSVSSNKGHFGHTLSAAGIFNVIAAARAIGEGLVPPTANYGEPDPECDLDYTPRVARRRAIEGALVNAFAFGGQNAAAVLLPV